MKTKMAFLFCILFYAGSTFAQQGQRMTVEERVKNVMEKVKPALGLSDEQAAKTDSVYTGFYNDQRKMMESMRSTGERPDRSVFEKMTSDRDVKLKAIFTPDQFKKFKDEVEPSLRPQRRQQ